MDVINGALQDFQEKREGARRFHAESIGADVDPYKCFSDFLCRIAARDVPGLAKVYGSYRTKTALSESAGGTTGGYLVPPELRADLMRDVAENAIIRPRATVVPMNSYTLDLPVWDATTVPSTNVAPFWGGLQMAWAEEASTFAETEPKFREVSLTAWQLGGYALVSYGEQYDATGLNTWLRTAFARSIAWYEDAAFIYTGDGVGQPMSMTNAACTSVQTRSGSKTFAAADAQNMVNALYSPNDAKACWIMSNAVGAKLTALTGWIPNGPMILHGLPIYRTVKQPPLGTKGDVLLVDPSLYIIGDRQEVAIDVSEHVKFTTAQLTWRFFERVDGQPMLNNVITLPDGASPVDTASPFVALSTL